MFDHLDKFSDRICLIDQSGSALSYGDMLRHADAVTTALGADKKLVFIAGKNAAATIIAYIGAWRGNHTIHLIDPDRIEENTRLSATYQPNAIIWCDASLPRVEMQQVPEISLHTDLAVLLSTSGSTGTSKFVKLSQANVAANTRSIITYLGLTQNDRAITTLKPFYSYGFSVINTHLEIGASLVLSDLSVQDPEFWDTVRRHDVTNIPGVPFTFETIAKEGVEFANLPKLRFMTQAGGKLSPSLVAHFAQIGAQDGFDFYVMYGQTEAAPRISYLPPEMAARHPGAIGKPVPGGTLDLFDSDGRPILEPGIEGELVYSGPNVMVGYATSRDELTTAEQIERLFTGDLAIRNKDGLFEITGRKSRMVKPFGLRISLDEIEAKVKAQFGQAAAIGLEDTVVILLEQGDLETGAKIRSSLSESTGLPESCFLVKAEQEIPRLSNGKTDYKTLQAQTEHVLSQKASLSDFFGGVWTEFWGILSGKGARPTSVMQVFQSVFPRSKIVPETSFRSLGGDSLALLQVQLLLEDYLVTLPDGWESMPVGDLEALAQPVTI